MSVSKRVAAATVAVVIVLSGCSDDEPPADDETIQDSDDRSTTTTAPTECFTTTHGEDVPEAPEPATGDLDIPEVPGACPVPLVDLGLGLAVPIGWDASRLDTAALDQLAEASLVRPAFLASARHWSSEGAVFYAAGVSESGEVSDLKVYVSDGVDTTAEALEQRADDLANSGNVNEPSISGDPASGRLRVDFTVSMPSAEDPETQIDGVGSELLVADGDRLWRFILISESPEAQNGLLLMLDSSITFDNG